VGVGTSVFRYEMIKRRPWTEEQDRQLAFDWGVFSLDTIARRHGRTPMAIVQRAKKLSLGAPSRGTLTVCGLAEATGYGRSQIRSAARALGIVIGKRTSAYVAKHRNRRYTSIDEEDVERIIAFLGSRPDGARIRAEVKGAWGGPGRGGPKPEGCVSCGTSERPHYAKGMCGRCYDKRRKNRSGAGLGC
jgi:hypothetical protein